MSNFLINLPKYIQNITLPKLLHIHFKTRQQILSTYIYSAQTHPFGIIKNPFFIKINFELGRYTRIKKLPFFSGESSPIFSWGGIIKVLSWHKNPIFGVISNTIRNMCIETFTKIKMEFIKLSNFIRKIYFTLKFTSTLNSIIATMGLSANSYTSLSRLAVQFKILIFYHLVFIILSVNVILLSISLFIEWF